MDVFLVGVQVVCRGAAGKSGEHLSPASALHNPAFPSSANFFDSAKPLQGI